NLCCFFYAGCGRAALVDDELIVEKPLHAFHASCLSVPEQLRAFAYRIYEEIEQPVRLYAAGNTHDCGSASPCALRARRLAMPLLGVNGNQKICLAHNTRFSELCRAATGKEQFHSISTCAWAAAGHTIRIAGKNRDQ